MTTFYKVCKIDVINKDKNDTSISFNYLYYLQ